MQLESNRHADDECLEKYSIGSLPETELSEVEEHLLVCARCQQRLEEVDAYARAMRRAAAQLRREEQSRGRLPAWISDLLARPRLVWGLGLAVLALVFLIGRHWMGPTAAGPPVAVLLQASRGGESERAPAGKPLAFTIDLAQLPSCASYRIEMVNSAGQPVWESRAEPRTGKIRAVTSQGFARGAYYVRLYSPSELLREFGLEVH